jgi:hypothetical protein
MYKFFEIDFNSSLVPANLPGQEGHESPEYGRTKEAYEGDTVSLTCSDENSRGRYSRVNFTRKRI